MALTEFIVHRSSFIVRRSSFTIPMLGFLLLASGTFALDPANPALVLGSDALGANPARLAARQHPRFTYRILDLETEAANNSLSLDQYNRYSGADLDDAAKRDILRSIPASGFRLGSAARTDLLRFSVGSFGLSVGTQAGAGVALPRDLFDLALWGNELNRQYSASTLGGDAIAYGDATVSFGVPLGKGFAAGIGLKYLRGLFTAQTTKADGYLITTPAVINSELYAGYRIATGGSGFGLDCGLTYERDRWCFGLALLNLNLGINWTDGCETGVFRVNLDSFSVSRMTRDGVAQIDNRLDPASPFRTQLPSTITLGASYQPFRFLTLGATLREGTASTPLSSTTPEATISAEYRGLRWLPLSVDASAGGQYGLMFGSSLGLDLKGFLVRVRLANTGGLIGHARGLRAGLSLTYRSWAPGVREPDPNRLQLHADPVQTRRF